MAINVRERGTVGCAYYVACEERLYCMEDVEHGGTDVVEALKTFVNPTVVIVPFSLDDAILDLIDVQKSSDQDDEADSQNHSLPYNVEFRVAGDFKFESAREKLASLDVGQSGSSRVSFVVPGDSAGFDDPDDFGLNSAGRAGQILAVGSSIDMESRISVGCTGAVLNYIGRRRSAASQPGDAAARDFFRISRVSMFSLKGDMFVNLDTLVSLQIVQSESHPHSQNQGPKNSGAKEGLSVYGLFHHFARTPQGRALLRQCFLRPSTDLMSINERLDTISIFLRPDHQPLMDKIVSHLKAIKNMRSVTINLRKGNSSGIMPGRSSGMNRTVWSSIREFLYRALEIRQTIGEMAGAHRLAIFEKIMRTFDGQTMSIIGSLITNTIDFEFSIEQHRTVVKPGVDFDLDETKRTHDGMESLLSHVAISIASEIPSVVDARLTVIFFPQIGFLICVRRIPDTTCGAYSGEEDEPWEQLFYTSDYVYFKESRTREMDAQFGDVYGRICDREIEIIQELAEKVLRQETLLTTVSDVCGEIDCMLALAQGAREYNLCRPQMTEENVLDIRGGRHLLQERTVPTFIANDTYLAGGNGDHVPMMNAHYITETPEPSQPSMMLITGPNYSGKSVYLKQVALIAFMAHMGSFVPAEKAVIGITDKILTRIWTRESVSRSQSAFMIDLQQMSLAMSLATRRSLLVIDEFGKGSESIDGAGLVAGVFTHFLSLGVECPKVIAATHFHEIFHPLLLPPHPQLSIHQMSIHLTNMPSSASVSTNSTDEITYLYSLQPGRTSSSYGTVCARMNGIPDHVVRNAEDLISMADRGEDLVALCARLPDQERDELSDAELVARRFLAGEIPDDGHMEGDLDMREWLGRVVLGELGM
ncbi:MutS 5 [Sphaceloma murrayae]|uniref:DNA mismatch repair protein MSH5 n=1 Tax=Sphaceloma murrayae TaxID=2082308 RepID=A0A2K1QVD1_9PEZI|nr:MutS 5 [Sphaceloma murrayae]